MARTADSVAPDHATLERRLKRLGFTDQEVDWTDRYLVCEHIVEPRTAPAASASRRWPASFAT